MIEIELLSTVLTGHVCECGEPMIELVQVVLDDDTMSVSTSLACTAPQRCGVVLTR